MAKRADQSAGQGPTDSRVAQFLRRAAPVLAAERGWNPQSRMKLKSLADDLKLPGPLFEAALRQLEQGDWSASDLTRYETEFVRYLNRYFRQQPGRVLTATHEQRATAAGQSQFQIAPHRARDLIRQVASDLGLSRVSRLDAEAHIAALIDETIGGAAELTAGMKSRVLAAASTWGLEQNEAEILIANRIAANRPAASSRRYLGKYLLAALAGILVFALLVWLFLAQFGVPESPGGSADVPVRPASGAPDSGVVFPAIWSDQTRSCWNDMAASDRQLALPRHLWLNEDPGERAAGLPVVLDLALGTVEPVGQQARQFLVSLVADQDPVTDELIHQLGLRIALPGADRISSGHVYESVFAAADLLTECCQSAGQPAVRAAIEAVFRQATGVADPGPNRRQIDEALTLRIWQNVGAACPRQPAAAARLFPILLDMTRARTPDAGQWAWPCAVEIFSAPGDAWQFMRESMQGLIEQANEDQLFQLFDVTLRLPEEDDRTAWLLPRLARGLGIDAGPLSSDQLTGLLRRRFGLAERGWAPATVRWSLLRDLPDYRTLLDPQIAATPQSIADAAHLATAAWLLWRGEADANPGWLELSDELIAAGPRTLSVRRFAERGREALPVFGRVQRRPLPSDVQTRRVALDKLQNPQAHPPAARAKAFERLAGVASRFPDVTREQASAIARFMLNATETPEVVAIEQQAPQLSHWLNLAWAVSDQVRSPETSLDQAVTVASLLTGLEFAGQDTDRWRSALRRALLQRIAEALQRTAELQGEEDDYLWDELNRYLMELYRIRCQGMAVPASQCRMAMSPAELNRLLIRQWSPTDRRLVTTGFLAADTLDDTILTGQLLVAVLGQDQYATQQQTDPESGGLPRPARQLLANEQELLKLLATRGHQP